jgi:hypothetical protein
MVNYETGKVYRISSTKSRKSFIGSTTKKYLSGRMANYRSAYKAWQNGNGYHLPIYDFFDKYGIESCYMILIEKYPCNCNSALKLRERYWNVRMPNSFLIKKVNCTEEEKQKLKKRLDKINLTKRYECVYCGGSPTSLHHKQNHKRTKKHIFNKKYATDVFNNVI